MAILFTGHSGPHAEDIKTMVNILQPHFATRLAFFTDGDLMSIGAGHGGKIETSLLWAIKPDCVDISRAPEHGLPEPRFAMGEDAKQSDRRLGEKLIDEMVANVGAKAKELLKEYDLLQPLRQPLTYDQIEQIWDMEVKPEFSKFASMQSLWTGQEEPPKSSRWYVQWQIPNRS